MDKALMDEIAAIVSRAEQAAYERGRTEAKREMLTYLTDDAPAIKKRDQPTEGMVPPVAQTDPLRGGTAPERQRAPRGAVVKLIYRALSSGSGLRVKDILEHAEGASEAMIQQSSIGNALRIGRKAGRYRESEGRWYLASRAIGKAEGLPFRGQPSASEVKQD